MNEASLSAQTLSGASALVTRPAALSQNLCHLIESRGGTALAFPLVEINDAADDGPLNAAFKNLATTQIAIFISPSAVQKTLEKAGDALINTRHLKIAAIGRATADQLLDAGLNVDIVPRSPYNSEALLKHEALQASAISDSNILIFRGDSGRELLFNTLSTRGARVEYIQAYQRNRPSADMEKSLHHWRHQQINIITLSSQQSLKNLYDLIMPLDADWLFNTALIVQSDACLQSAQSFGFLHVGAAIDATDNAMLIALEHWCKNKT